MLAQLQRFLREQSPLKTFGSFWLQKYTRKNIFIKEILRSTQNDKRIYTFYDSCLRRNGALKNLFLKHTFALSVQGHGS